MNTAQILEKITEFQNNPTIMAFVVAEAIAKADGDESKVDAHIAAGLVGVCLYWLD
jgi:hypothetical protein